MDRVIIDTNIYVSFLISKNNSSIHKIWKLWQSGKIVVFHSKETLEELARVLLSEKIRKLTKFSKEEIKQYLKLIAQRSILIELEEIPEIIERDPSDNKFLALAFKGSCQYLITGDKDLLDLGNYKNTKILTPRQFIEK